MSQRGPGIAEKIRRPRRTAPAGSATNCTNGAALHHAQHEHRNGEDRTPRSDRALGLISARRRSAAFARISSTVCFGRRAYAGLWSKLTADHDASTLSCFSTCARMRARHPADRRSSSRGLDARLLHVRRDLPAHVAVLTVAGADSRARHQFHSMLARSSTCHAADSNEQFAIL